MIGNRVTVQPGSKQIMLDGVHLCDAVSPEAAEAVGTALNKFIDSRHGLISADYSALKQAEDFFA